MQFDLVGTAVLSTLWVGLSFIPQFSQAEIAGIVTLAAFIAFHLQRQWRMLQLQRRIDKL